MLTLIRRQGVFGMRGISSLTSLFLLIGVALALIAIIGGLISTTNTDALTATADDGEIVQVKVTKSRKKSGSTSKKYKAKVTFTDSDHRSHTVWSLVSSSSSSRYSVGDHVSVMYDPWNPDDGCLIVGDEDLVESNRILVIIFSIGSAISFVLAGVCAIRDKVAAAKD